MSCAALVFQRASVHRPDHRRHLLFRRQHRSLDRAHDYLCNERLVRGVLRVALVSSRQFTALLIAARTDDLSLSSVRSFSHTHSLCIAPFLRSSYYNGYTYYYCYSPYSQLVYAILATICWASIAYCACVAAFRFRVRCALCVVTQRGRTAFSCVRCT